MIRGKVHYNADGEPVTNLVVDSWRDVPKSIANDCMERYAHGMVRHPRLGIYIVDLSELQQVIGPPEQAAAFARCTHPEYRDGHCASLTCPNYVGKYVH